MSRAERRKGIEGEREVLRVLSERGFTVRGLEATGDHLAFGHGLVLHVETKRQETARPWQWWEQAAAETPPSAVTLVAFRRSRSPWLALIRLDALAEALDNATRGRTPNREPHTSLYHESEPVEL